MTNIPKLALALMLSAAALAGCRPAADRQQAREAGAAAAGAQAGDVDTLPPDESVATPSNQLAAGDAEPTER